MYFFTALYKSCYDLLWLKTARTRVGKAWGYFFLFILLVTLATAIPLALALPTAVNSFSTVVKEKVPEFTATIANGELSITGVTQPFIYKTSENGDTVEGSFVVIVDTVTTSSASLLSFLEEGQSGVLVTKDKLEMYQASKDQSRTQYWNKADDVTFSRADLLTVISQITSTKVMVIVGLVVFIFMYLGIVIGKLFGLVIISLIVYLIAAIAKRKVDFGQLFTIGLYAVTLPTVVAAVLHLAGVTFGNLYVLALLAFLLAVVFTKDPGAEIPAPEKPVEPKV